jgi:hypothetical protein
VEEVRYVQRVRKGGLTHLYFRKGDYREGPLTSADGSEELKAEVAAILKRMDAVAVAQKPKAGTVGGMLRAYTGHDGKPGSAEFLGNARSTQAEYKRLGDEMFEDCGDHPLADVTQAWLREMRDAWALRGHRAANQRLQVLKNALAPAIDDEADHRIAGDPFAKLKNVKRPASAGEAHPSWTDDEVEAAIGFAIARGKPGLARAIALGRWAGFRRGTICAVPLHARISAFDAEGGKESRLLWTTEKRQVLCDKREDPRLTDLLGRTPSKALTIAYNAKGDPWKPRQLNQAVDRLMAALAKAGNVRAAADDEGEIYCPLDLHGLRHARGLELALAGASDAEIMGQLEHASPRAAQIYRRQAQRKALADQGQDRIDNVVKLKAARKARTAGEQKL